MKINIILFSVLLLPLFSSAQKGVLRGKVIDAKSGKNLPFATVLVTDKLIGTTTNEKGHYSLTNLNAGKYFLEVMFLGYEKQTRLAVVGENDTLTIDFGLTLMATELESVEVTAHEYDLLNEPIHMTKLGSVQIERLITTNTAELLEDVGGVSVARAGNWGSKPYFQGMTDSRIIMFIDGIKTTQSCPLGMDACSATIEPDMISNMDVQVGPGSAQYGSGNMGGVISVTTNDSQYKYLNEFKADLEFASRYKSVSNSRTGVLSFKGGNKKFDFATGIGGGWHDNYKIPFSNEYTFFPKNEIPYSGFNSNWLYINLRYRPATGHQIAFVSQIYRGNSIGWPSLLPGTNTIIPEEKRNLFALKYKYEHDGKYFKKLNANIGYQPMHHNMVNYTPGNTQYIGFSKTDNYQASVKSYFSFGKNHFITAGMDGWIWKMNAERQTVTDSSETPFVAILNHGIMFESGFFVLDRFIYNKLIMDFGFRMNNVYSDALPAEDGILSGNLKDDKFVWTGNIAPLYKLNKYLSISGALVKGYSAATPVDRFISAPMFDGFYHYGNPDLSPEINISKRLGFRGMYNKWRWNTEYFHNNVLNLIQRALDTAIISPIQGLRGVKRSQNITSVIITGVSTNISYYATPYLQFSLNASYLYGYDNNRNPLPNIAPFEITPKITYENSGKGLWLALRADIATEQNRFAPQYAEIYTAGYAIFNLNGGWKISDWIEVSAGINNLANQYYRKHLNQAQLPEPGLNIFASAKFSLPVIGNRKAKPSLKDAKLVNLKIEGMACQFCARTVRERSESLFDVIQSIIYLPDGKAEIIVDKNFSIDELVEVIQRAGFKVQIISIEFYETRGK